MQFPSSLPIVKNPEASINLREPIPLHEMPEGYVGKLIVYKSGKVKLLMGGVKFDVNPGTQLSFHQEAVIIDHDQQKAIVLGDVQKRLLISPNLDDIL